VHAMLRSIINIAPRLHAQLVGVSGQSFRSSLACVDIRSLTCLLIYLLGLNQMKVYVSWTHCSWEVEWEPMSYLVLLDNREAI